MTTPSPAMTVVTGCLDCPFAGVGGFDDSPVCNAPNGPDIAGDAHPQTGVADGCPLPVTIAVNALPALLDAAERATGGLVFGPVTDGQFGPIRYAVAADGALYEMDTEPGEPGVTWRMSDDHDAWGCEDTPGKAIAAAQAHDVARLKGGE